MELTNLNIPNWSDMAHWMPEAVLTLTFLAALIGDLVVRGRRPWVPMILSVIGLVIAGIFTVLDLGQPAQTIMGDLIIVDGMAAFFRLLLIFTGLATVLFAWTSEEIMGRARENKGEFFALTVMLTLATCVIAEARHLLMLFLAMEGVGLSSYVMAGYMRFNLRSTEASLKYVLFGAVSSAVMLYGLSLLYGLTGSMDFLAIREVLLSGRVDAFGLLVAVILIFAGFSFKVAAVPFHFWCPDVYHGAPTPVSALFSVGPKAAGFALMIRFFYSILAVGPDAAASAGLIQQINWPLLLSVISAVTMTFGNLVALRQTNVKRMLAYSSIAHVGYLLMGFVLLSEAGLAAILFYLLVYTLASLTGVPPFAGFIGKFYLFTAAMDKSLFWLVIVAGLNSVVGLYYYFKVVKAMFLTTPPEGADTAPLKLSWLQYVVLAVLAVPTLGLGLFFGPAMQLVRSAMALFAAGV